MMDFDRIAASAPVNALAARQIAKGEHWEPEKPLQDYFPDMPPMKPYQSNGSSTCIDFTGMEVGRLKVLGLLVKNANRPASWVCRCKCGGFCTRTAKSLRTAKGSNTFVPACGRCYYQTSMEWRRRFLPVEVRT